MGEATEPGSEEAAKRRQLRLVGGGLLLSGLITVLVAVVSTRPYGILVVGLGALAVATMILERLQGAVIGLSLGFLTGSVGVWLWPYIAPDEGYLLAGVLLCVAGVLNVFMTPVALYAQRLGERLAER